MFNKIRDKNPMDNAHPIDSFVGNKIKKRREMLNITQKELGAILGITFQQVQKYEKATNRVPSSRLFELSQALKVTPDFFFDGVRSFEDSYLNESDVEDYMATDILDDDSLDAELAHLIKNYKKIKDPNLRKKIIEFTELLAK